MFQKGLAVLIPKQHKHRLYNWTSVNTQHQSQINYIIRNRRWRSAVQAAETLLGTDYGNQE